MNTRKLNYRAGLAWVVLCTIFGAGILTSSCIAPSKAAKEPAALPLLNTQWRLTHLGDEVIDNPAGERAVNFLLQPANSSVVGFSGCNRMFGRYALDGASLKFDGMGGTRMFCEAQMPLEQRYLAMFSQAARWEISGSRLRLLDEGGKTVAIFEATN